MNSELIILGVALKLYNNIPINKYDRSFLDSVMEELNAMPEDERLSIIYFTDMFYKQKETLH